MSVDADISASEDLFGKSVDDLQTGITVGNNAITGTLKYVSDYTGFSGEVSEQSGNYLAIHSETDVEDTTITVEVVGGHSGPVTLGADGIIVDRIESTSQSIRVTASKEGYETTTKTFALTALTLQEE